MKTPQPDNQKRLFNIPDEPLQEQDVQRFMQQQKLENKNFDIDAQIRRWLSECIKSCPLSRYEIAGKLSELLGKEITKYQLDTWTAESKEGYHLPASYIAALCAVLQDYGIIYIYAGLLDIQLVDNRDYLWLQYAQAQEMEKKIKLKKKAIERQLQRK
jgi:hypothetical protein